MWYDYLIVETNENPDNLDGWWDKTRYWLLRYRRIIGILGILILLICGGSFWLDNKSACQQSGGAGGAGASAAAIVAVATDANPKGKSKGLVSTVASIPKMAVSGVGKGTRLAHSKIITPVADKFAMSSSFIYNILYNIAFVIMIALVFLPSIGIFIIGIICFTLLNKKLNYIKSL